VSRRAHCPKLTQQQQQQPQPSCWLHIAIFLLLALLIFLTVKAPRWGLDWLGGVSSRGGVAERARVACGPDLMHWLGGPEQNAYGLGGGGEVGVSRGSVSVEARALSGLREGAGLHETGRVSVGGGCGGVEDGVALCVVGGASRLAFGVVRGRRCEDGGGEGARRGGLARLHELGAQLRELVAEGCLYECARVAGGGERGLQLVHLRLEPGARRVGRREARGRFSQAVVAVRFFVRGALQRVQRSRQLGAHGAFPLVQPREGRSVCSVGLGQLRARRLVRPLRRVARSLRLVERVAQRGVGLGEVGQVAVQARRVGGVRRLGLLQPARAVLERRAAVLR
jgi:hypothetical protein